MDSIPRISPARAMSMPVMIDNISNANLVQLNFYWAVSLVMDHPPGWSA